MKFFILMIAFVSTLSASTVTTLYLKFGSVKPTPESVDTMKNINDTFMARSHQDRRTMMNKVASHKT